MRFKPTKQKTIKGKVPVANDPPLPSPQDALLLALASLNEMCNHWPNDRNRHPLRDGARVVQTFAEAMHMQLDLAMRIQALPATTRDKARGMLAVILEAEPITERLQQAIADLYAQLGETPMFVPMPGDE